MAQLDFILNLKADALDKVEKRITRLEKNGLNLKFNKASLEKELDNVVKAAQKKPVEVLNYSKRLGRIMDGFNYQVPKEPKDKNSNEWKTWKSKVEKAENSWFESIRSFAPEIEAINNFAKMFAKRLKQSEDVVFDMLKGLSAEKLEEFQLGMTGKGSSGEISKLVSAITKAQKTGNSKFAQEVNKELEVMKVARTADNTTTTSFRNAYIPNKNYTEEEKKAMIKVTSDGKAVSTDVKNYLELEVILGRITEKKKELNGQDLTDLGVLKQLVQVSADEANVRQRMAQLAKKGNIAKQSEKNGWDIKNIPEIDPYAVNLAITQAKNNYGAVMQSQLEKIADEAFGQLITKIQNMLNFSELSDSGVLDVFGDLAKIKDEARQFIETVNDLVVAEEKVKQANDKFKKDKLGFSVENAENAKELVGYLQRYVSLGGNLDDIAEKLNINKDLVESFKTGFKGKNELSQMLRDTQNAVSQNGNNTIGQLVANNVGGNVQPTSQTNKPETSVVTEKDVNETDLYVESLKKLGSEYDNVKKYAVDAKTAIEEFKKLSKKYNEATLSDEEFADMIGFSQRYLSLGGKMTSGQQELFDEVKDINRKVLIDTEDMTQKQLSIIEQLRATANSVNNNSLFGNDQINSATTALTNYLAELQKIEAQEGRMKNEHVALFNEKGEMLDSAVGEERKSSIKTNAEATTIVHSHPFNENWDNLRFDDKDFESFFNDITNNKLRQSITYCGNELLALDISNVDPSKLNELGQELNLAIWSVMTKLGNLDIEEFKKTGELKLKETDLSKLGEEFQNEYTRLINGYTKSIVEYYKGNVSRIKLNPDGSQTNVGFNFSEIEDMQLTNYSSFIKNMPEGLLSAIANMEQFIKDAQALKTLFNDLDISYSLKELGDFRQALKEGGMSNEEFYNSLNQIRKLAGEDGLELYEIQNKLLGLTKGGEGVGTSAVGGLSEGQITAITSALTNLEEKLEEIRKITAGETETGFVKSLADISASFETLKSNLSFESVKDSIGEVKTAIESINFKTMSEEAETAITSLSSQFEELGKTIGETIKAGMQQGIDEGTTNIETIPTSPIPATDTITEPLQQTENELDKVDEKVQKIMYHWGNFNEGKIGEGFGSMITSYFNGLNDKDAKSPFGAFGSGVYTVSSPERMSSIDPNIDQLKDFKALDVTDIKVFVTQTEERATELFNFLTELQRLCINAGSGFNYNGTFDKEVINVETMYKQAQSIFGDMFMTAEDFSSFVSNMANLVKETGIGSGGAIKIYKLGEDKSNISTRFMKQLGYMGIDNTGTSYDSFTHGNVLFPGVELKVLESYKTANELIEYHNKLVAESKSQTETPTASNSAINAQKEALISLLKELKTLQDTIQDGNRSILPKYDRGILQDYYGGQIRKNSTTKNSIKNALRRYNDMKDDVDNGTYGIYDEKSLQIQLQEIARYVAGYRSLDEAQTLFGKKNQDIWNQVVEMINKAKSAQEAYDTYEARQFRITGFLNTDTMKFGDYSTIEKNLRNGDIESAFNYVVEKYGLIQQASKDTTDKQVNQQGGTKTPKEETVVSNTANTTSLPPQSDNSQKILAEQQALEQLSQTLTIVIKAIQAKTEAFANEGTTVANTVQKEIAERNALDGMLQAVKREVDLITTAIATLPNINIKADLSNLNSGEVSEEVIARYGELAEKLKNIDTNNINIESISALKELNLPETAGENLQKVANAINNIKASLNNLGEGGKSFIADIKEIVNAGEALKNFNEILKKTKTEREQASKQVKGEEVFEPKNLTGTAKANSELITREMEEAMREISVNNQESVPINLSDDFKKASDQIILDMQRVQGEVQKVQFVTNSEYSGIATLLDDENIEAEIAGVQKLTGAIVTYKNELGEVITTTYSLQKKFVPVFDKDGNPVMEGSNDSNSEPRQKKTMVSFFAQDQEKLSRKTIDAEKNKAAAIENTNVKLDRQLDKIKKVQSSYDQDLAPGLTKFVSKDTEDYKELSEMYSSIEKKIASMRGKDVSKEEMSNLITMIADYERLAKIKIQANNVTKKEMGGQELKVAVKGLIEKYEQLIAKTSQYGEATKDITNHLKEQLELLKQSKTEGKDKISTDKFYEFQAGYKVDKAEFGARQPELNNEEDKINGYYTTMISNLRQIKTLKSELPKLDEKSAKEAKSQIKRLQEQVRYRRKIIEGLDLSTRARFSDKQKTIDNLNWQIGYQQKKINGKATAEDEKKAQRLAKEQADIQQKRDVQSAESKASFSKTEQKDYYDALTVSVKDYLKYLEKEKSATGELKDYYANLKNAAKDSIRSIREDMDKNNIRTDANKEADIVGMFNNSQNSIRENAAKRKQAENEAQEKMLEEAYRMNAEFDKKKEAQYEKDAQAYETAYTKAIQKVRDKRMKAFGDMAKKEQAESEKKAKSDYSYNQNKAYKDVNDLFSRYETVTKRMEKGESVDRRKDFEEASSLLTEIESKMEQIGKSGLYDSAKDDAVLRRWENLERVIDDIRAKVASDAWDNYYKDQSKQAEMIEEAYRMNAEFDKKRNAQAEKKANKFDADVDKQLADSKEAQRKSTVNQAADIQKSVWESILQIRNEISKLELEDESANTDKISALKEEESILQAVYNDQERILRLNATKKEYSSQRDALSSLNSKAKNEEEKIITDAVKEVNSKLEAQEKLLDQIAKKYAEIKKARAEGKDTSAMEKDLANLRNSYKSNTTELNSGKYDDVYSPDERRERLKTYASKDTKVEQANIDISEKQDKATNTANNKQIIEDYKELISLEKQLHELRTKESVGFNIDQEEISNLEEKIAAKKSEVESIVETTNMTDRAKKSQEDYNATVKELQSIFAKNSNGIQNVPLADFSSRLETVKTQMPELEQEVSDAYDKINKLTESFSKGKISVTDYQKKIEDLVTNLERIEKVIQPGDMDEAKSALEELFRQKGAQVKSVKTSKDGNTLTFTGTQYDKATKQTKELVGTVDIATGHVRAFERRSSEAMSNFQKAVAGFRGKMGEVVRYFATFVSVYQVINAIKQAVQQVIEFDTALSEMRKVSSASVSSLKELQERSFEVANQVGSTALQIQKSTADFLRLGKPQQKLRLAPLYGNI